MVFLQTRSHAQTHSLRQWEYRSFCALVSVSGRHSGCVSLPSLCSAKWPAYPFISVHGFYQASRFLEIVVGGRYGLRIAIVPSSTANGCLKLYPGSSTGSGPIHLFAQSGWYNVSIAVAVGRIRTYSIELRSLGTDVMSLMRLDVRDGVAYDPSGQHVTSLPFWVT